MPDKKTEDFQELCNQTNEKMDLFLDMEPSRLEMIKGKRDFIKQIIILSSGIIAFAIPILDKGGIINFKPIYNISLIGFIIAIISGMIYLYWLNKQEQDTYKNFVSFFSGFNFDDDIDSMVTNLTDGLKNIKSELPNPTKFHRYEKLTQLFLISIFVISLILLVISVIL